MIYIRTNEELITEKMNFKKWKYYLIGLGISAFIGYNFGETNTKLDAESMYKIIDDIESQPTASQKILIDKVKKSMIDEAKSNNKLTDSQKEMVINAINYIKVVMTSYKNVNLINGDPNEKALAAYMKYTDADKINKRVLLISEDKLKNNNTLNLTHEMYHLIDDILGNNGSNYSETAEMIKLLDKDIIMKNPQGIKKIEKKLEFFLKKQLERPNDKEDKQDSIINLSTYKAKNQKPLTREEEEKIKQNIVQGLKGFIYEDKDYMTSPQELYVRFHGLKRWLLEEKVITDVNQPITKKMIIYIFTNSNVLRNVRNDKIDYFELLFMLNIDITNDVESEEDKQTLKKANSIVSNFSDYKNNIV